MLDFSQAPEPSTGDRVLIPEGTLVGGVIALQQTTDGKFVHTNPANGNQYLKATVEIQTAPFKGQKIFDIIGVVPGPGTDDGFMTMSDIKIKAILETNGAGPNNHAGYAINSRADINGMRCAARVMVDAKAQRPRNQIGAYLSPIAQSTKDHFERLTRGDVHPPDSSMAAVPRPPVAEAPPAAPIHTPEPPNWLDEPERAFGT